MASFALVLLVPIVDVAGIAARIRRAVAARCAGAFLVLVSLGQGGLWDFLIVRFALTRELPADIPADGQHLTFALDLALLVPPLVVAGILLFRRTAVGLVMGAAVSLFGLVSQVNLQTAAVFQEAAGVPGVKAFPIRGHRPDPRLRGRLGGAPGATASSDLREQARKPGKGLFVERNPRIERVPDGSSGRRPSSTFRTA